MRLTAGVVAVQGDVTEHASAIRAAAREHGERADVREIRRAGIVPECDLLVLPGGESTTISRLLHGEGIAAEIREHVADGRPVLATCAGLIVASRDARDERVDELGLLDVAVDRNAYGRQADSFETDLDVRGLENPFHAVFIRAPAVHSVGAVGDGANGTGPSTAGTGPSTAGTGSSTAGADPVDGTDTGGPTVLAEFDDRPVAVREGPVVGTSFHPELTDDYRIHDLAFFEGREWY